MYLVAIHLPIHIDGERRYLAADWLKSLRLLRDSLANRFGPLTVVAPSRPYDPLQSPQPLVPIERSDEIAVIPSFDNRCRASRFWLQHRQRWLYDLRHALAKAEVVHTSLDDLYRPIAFTAFREAIRLSKPTVFVQDTDIALQARQLSAGQPLLRRTRASCYARLFELCCQHAVRHATLSLLKGSRLVQRYARDQCNVRMFHDTSICRDDFVDPAFIRERYRDLQYRSTTGQSLRFVYCGRLTPRKGLIDSLEIVSRARKSGCAIELDIIGHGEQREAILEYVAQNSLESSVRLLGNIAYGSSLFAQLREYDALLFTPLAEDTPRMIFDGYAAALPLVAYDIEYVRERSREESATWLLPSGDKAGAVRRIIELAQSPQRLLELWRAARAAAEEHAAEAWYRKRAEWTIEAVDQFHTGGQASPCLAI